MFVNKAHTRCQKGRLWSKLGGFDRGNHIKQVKILLFNQSSYHTRKKERLDILIFLFSL
jgi:hypothetical protein